MFELFWEYRQEARINELESRTRNMRRRSRSRTSGRAAEIAALRTRCDALETALHVLSSALVEKGVLDGAEIRAKIDSAFEVVDDGTKNDGR